MPVSGQLNGKYYGISEQIARREARTWSIITSVDTSSYAASCASVSRFFFSASSTFAFRGIMAVSCQRRRRIAGGVGNERGARKVGGGVEGTVAFSPRVANRDCR